VSRSDAVIKHNNAVWFKAARSAVVMSTHWHAQTFQQLRTTKARAPLHGGDSGAPVPALQHASYLQPRHLWAM